MQITKKINLRLILIVAVCGIIAMTAVSMIYSDAQQRANPESMKTVAVFTRDIKQGEVIKEDAIILAKWPESKVPETALTEAGGLIGKRLAYAVHKGQPAFADTAVERGYQQIDTGGFEIGIDVPSISNFLGAQVKPGGKYLLLHRAETGETAVVSLVTVTGIIDATGKLLVNESGVIKTVNVAVEDQNTLMWISGLKIGGEFELVRPPEDFKITAGQVPAADPVVVQ